MTTTNLKTLQLDGQSGYAALASASALGLYDGDFTVEAWIRIDAWGTDYLPVLGTAATAARQGLHLAIFERRPYLGFYQADTAGRSELELATWYHLAWRYTKDGGEQAIFVNGVLDASATGKGAFLGTDTVWIGRYADAHFFKGRIAELRIWRRARTAAEILAGMHQRMAGDEPDLVGVWPLDDGEGEIGANAKASLQGENLGAMPRRLPAPPSTHAVRFDGIAGCVDVPGHTSLEGLDYTWEAWIRPEGPPPRKWASVLGPRRQVMEFDGVDDYVAVDGLHYAAAGAIEAITVEAWIRTSNNTGECCIASWDRSEYWRLSVGYGTGTALGRIYWGTTAQGSTTNDMHGDVNVADGEWHFITVTYDRASETKTIYVDGDLDRSITVHAGRALGTGVTRYGFIGECSEAASFDGTTNDLYYFDGQMAEVRIWDHARSEAEIRQDMDRRLSGEEAGLVACWRLGHLDHQGDTWDIGPNGYRGAGRGGVAVVDAGTLPLLDGDSGLLLAQDGTLRHRYPSEAGVDGPADIAAGGVPWNLWRHVAITNDGTTARTLIDGEVVSEASVTALVARSGGLHLGEHLRGTVAEVRVWNLARTPEEIAAGMGRSLAGDEAGLVGYWPLGESSGTAAACPVSSELDATVRGGERVPRFDVNEVLELNGTSSYLEIPHAGDVGFVKPGQDFTLELWVRADDQAGDEDERVVVEKWRAGGGFPYALRYRGESGRYVFARSSGVTPYPEVVSTSAFADGALHHLAGVKAGSELRLYVDGELQGQAADTVASTIRGTPAIFAGSRAGRSHFFKGLISELRLWRRARTQEEIRAGRDRRLTGDELDLAGYWPLDAAATAAGEPTDERAVRDGVIRPAGVLTGAAWADTTALPLLAADAAAPLRAAPAVEFNGRTSAVTVPESASLTPATTFTVEAWVRPAITGTAAFLAPVVSRCDAVGGWELRASDLEYAFLLTVGTTRQLVSWTPPGGEHWVHLAGRFDGTRVELLVNGVAVAGGDAVGEITPAPGPLYLGRSAFWAERRFTGELAEVRLWNVARGAAELQARLCGRLAGSEPGLVGYWPLSEGTGETLAHPGEASLAGTAENVEWVAAELPPRLPPGEVPAVDMAWRIQTLEALVTARSEELRKAIQRQKYRETRKAELQAQIAEADAAWAAEQAETLAALAGQVAAREGQIAALDAAQREADLAQVDALLDDVVEESHQRIEAARAVLAARGGNYRLGRVALDLKYVAGAGGRGAIFPPLDAAVAGERMTALELDFTAGEAAEEKEETVVKTAQPSVVPEVVGYTAAVAERKLRAAGYRVEVHAQAVSSTADVGRVVSQFPRPETEAPPTTRVRVFLGKAS